MAFAFDLKAPPATWGLPEHFDAWRPVQQDALDFIRTSPKRVKALCAPAGSGKSLIGIADALRSKKPTCYVTDSRALQDQVLHTFTHIGLVDLRGRSNYPCGMRDEYSCEDGYSAKCPHKGSISCPASAAEMRAAASWLVVTNYDKWIHSRRFGQGLNHIQRVIFDEGHTCFDALSRAMQVFLGTHEIEQLLHLNFPNEHDALFFETWKIWAQIARLKAEAMMRAARAKVHGGGHIPTAWVKNFTHLRNLARRLAILSTANPNNWVVDEVPKGYLFDPVQPGRYAESALLLGVPDVIIMSATLRPKTLYMTGISKVLFDFKEFPSEFDPARCPIYYVPTMRVDSRAKDLSMLWIRLDQIAGARQDRNGLVHTVSYARRDEILARSRFAPHMLINEKGEPATAMVELFKQRYPGAILVSPSVGQGHDFTGKTAEWQFICKVPFPPPSKVMKARTEVDPEYPHYLAMSKFVQMSGRVMRDKADRGETFIADDHFKWFMPRYRHLAPKWFHAFVREVSVLPAAPPRLD